MPRTTRSGAFVCLRPVRGGAGHFWAPTAGQGAGPCEPRQRGQDAQAEPNAKVPDAGWSPPGVGHLGSGARPAGDYALAGKPEAISNVAPMGSWMVTILP